VKLNSFVASLLPTFGKDCVIEDIRLTRNEITEYTAPSYVAAAELFKTWKFKSEDLDKMFGIFKRMVKGSGSDNCITTIEKGFKTILENLDYVEEQISTTYSEEVAGVGFTYKKANLLQLVECISFVSKFARKFLIYIYICETSLVEGNDTIISESLSPIEIDWLDANFVSFCTAFNVVTNQPAHVEKQVAAIPDIIITSENEHSLAATLGEEKIDPFQMKLIPIWLNPVYHVGMFIAEWQSDRYKAAKEEVKLLQLRKINLQKLSDGKPDAHIQQEIKYMEGRIQGINFKIAKMEKKNGL
jgi:hypothetical protein